MNKYLIDLLSEVNTVIIPSFGALTVVNRTNKDFMFMPYLKYDDGLLADFIAKKEGWPIGEAKDLISKYVNDITITLNKGGKYDFPEIGSFKKVEDEIVFDNWKATSFVQTNASSTVIPDQATTKSMEEISPKAEETEEVTVQEITAEDNSNKEQVVTEEEIHHSEFNRGSVAAGIVVLDDEKLSTEEANTVVEDPIIEIPQVIEENIIVEEPTIPSKPKEDTKEEVKMIPEEEQWKDDLDIPPVGYKPEQPKKTILEKAVRDKKPRRTPAILWAFIALVFIGGLATAGFYWEDVKRVFGNIGQPEYISDVEDEKIDEIEVPEVIESEEEVLEEEITNPSEEDTKVEEVVTKKEEENVIPVPSTNGSIDKKLPFQVIAGSFAEEQNAQKLIAKLKANGYDAEIFGVINNMHMVTIGSFTTEQEYQTKKAQLQEAGPHWLFKRK